MKLVEKTNVGVKTISFNVADTPRDRCTAIKKDEEMMLNGLGLQN